jgi:predicted PurR-regulated permease PerM
MPDRRAEQSLRTVAGAALLVGCLAVLFPFLTDVLWAIVLCFSTWPLYSRLLVLVRGRRSIAALLMTLAILLVLVAPFAVIAASLRDDIPRGVEAVRAFLDAGLPPPPDWLAGIPLVGERLAQFWSGLAGGSAERMAQLRRLVDPLKGLLLTVAAALGGGLLHMMLSLLIAFFIYRDGTATAAWASRVTDRLGGEQGRALLDLAGRTVRAVVYGILGTAVAQGIVAGIGFGIAGVPQAALLALLTFFLSVVPVGPVLIWVPVTIWFFARGDIAWGIFMLAWGLLISSVDNVVKPLIISRGGGGLSFIVILLGILGGATTFGFIGVFLGPTLLAVGVEILRFWTLSRAATAAAAAAAVSSETVAVATIPEVNSPAAPTVSSTASPTVSSTASPTVSSTASS